MKTTQYVKQEKAISAADKGGIRERWMWGLRLLRDPQAVTDSGKSLRHGVSDELIAAEAARGYKLNAREIQRRLQCARIYPTEAQIRQVLTDFETWDELINANFPEYQVSDGEPEADHRTATERRRDHARAAVDLANAQGELFPLDDFEPATTTLDDLSKYTREMEEMTARFAKRDRERREYLERLITAADNNMGMTWKEAHDRLGDGTEAGLEDDLADDDPPLDED